MLTERKERILRAVNKQSDELFYDFVTGIREWFKEAMLPNETFIFDEPCDNFYGYVIYAIHNYDGVIQRNPTHKRGHYSGFQKAEQPLEYSHLNRQPI